MYRQHTINPRFRRAVLCAAALTIGSLLPAIFAPEASGVGSMSGGGQISSSLSLSSGGLANNVAAANPNAHIVVQSTRGSTDSTDTIDFGELSTASNETLVVGVNFQLRGNSSYKLNISEAAFTARALRHRGRDVSGSDDHGSFIQIRVGAVNGSGPRANAQATTVSGAMSQGFYLNQISQGSVTQSSTTLCSGGAPSTGGTVSSPDNAVEIPIYFSIPGGLELAPGPETGSGSFQSTLQLGAFAQ